MTQNSGISSELINELIDETASSLSESLLHYWPAVNPEDNCIQEANLTYYFSIACFNNPSKNLFIYPEAAFKFNGDNRRIDLLVYNDTDKSILLVESKRLFSAEKAMSILEDIRKIDKFKPVSECNEDADICNSKNKTGLIMAVTQSSEIKEWWMTTNNNDCLDKFKSAGWVDLKDKLYKDNKFQPYVLNIGFKPVKSHFENWDNLFILYALFEANYDDPIC